MSVILSAKNIYKSFKKTKDQSLEVLKDVSLDLEQGKINVIIGASGSGKSTLLHILSGLDKADKGEVVFDNKSITNLSDDELSMFRSKNMGFVFQFHHLLPEFTARENIAISKMIAGTDQKEANKIAEKYLELVGLLERESHKPAELSGGEQQRIAIARALINEPKIIFADEPTGNLDTANGDIIHRLFTKLKNDLGMTFLIVTHNPELVKLADVVYEMKDGKIFVNNNSR
ncbi:MAG: ABC transporter ATP-binding protein [Rhodothermaceae bacterium]